MGRHTRSPGDLISESLNSCICRTPFPTRSLPQVLGAGYGHIPLGGASVPPMMTVLSSSSSPPQTALCWVGVGVEEDPH